MTEVQRDRESSSVEDPVVPEECAAGSGLRTVVEVDCKFESRADLEADTLEWVAEVHRTETDAEVGTRTVEDERGIFACIAMQTWMTRADFHSHGGP